MMAKETERIDREAVKKQAKKIMDDFMLALDSVRDSAESIGTDRETDKRGVSEKGGIETDPEFRQRMFRNAPKVKDDCIQAEKKSW